MAVLQTVAILKCLLCLWQISDQGLKLNYPSKCCLLTLVLHGSLCCKHSFAFLPVQLAAMLHLFLSFCRIRDRGAPLSIHCLCLCKGSFHFACHNLNFCFKPSKLKLTQKSSKIAMLINYLEFCISKMEGKEKSW